MLIELPSLRSVSVFLIVLAAACGGTADDASPPDPAEETQPPPRRRPPPDETADEDPTVPRDTWCTSRSHAFCADFDGAELEHGWDGIWYAGGRSPGSGYDEVSSDRSAPNALSITERPVTPGELGGGPRFSRDLDVTNPNGARVAIDVLLASTGLDSDTHALAPVSLSFSRRDGDGWVYVSAARLDLRNTRTELHRTPAPEEGGDWSVPAEQLPRGRWVHVEITIDLASAPPVATMTYDGEEVARGSLGALEPATIDSVHLEIGMTLRSPHAQTFEAAFDNVTLDWL
jgi:hypothetical protein